MRFARMCGLVAIVTVVATAFIGVASASATVLCEATPSGAPNYKCPTGKDVVVNGVITAEAVNPTITNNINDVVCEKSEITIKVTNTGGAAETVRGEITALSFTNCQTKKTPKTTCNTTVVGLPYIFEVHWNSGTHDGTMTIGKHPGGVEPGVKVFCAGIIDCTFSAEPALTIVGGSPALILANGVALNKAGATCPTTASLDSFYATSGATGASLWVAKE